MRRSSSARALQHFVGLGSSGLRAPGRQAAPLLALRLELLAVPVDRTCTRLRGCGQQWRGFAQHAGAEQECVVSNAGIADYNGKYVLDPEYSDKFPGVGYRKQGSEQTLFGPIPWNGGTWGLSKNYGSFDYYVMSSAEAPPTSGWVADTEGIAGGAGLDPAPTVALSSEADAEEAASSNANSRDHAETEKAEARKVEASKADAEEAEAVTHRADARKVAQAEKARASEASAREADVDEAEELSPVERLQQELDELQDQSRAKKKELLLALADFENNKKKFMKEREGRRRTANTNFARRMVDIYREFEDLPAFKSSGRNEEGSPCAALQEGVTMTRNLFATALSKSDVERLPVELGTPVVNARHEVVGSATGDGSLTEGSIAEVVEAGWMMDLRSQTPRVLHKAQVKIVG